VQPGIEPVSTPKFPAIITGEINREFCRFRRSAAILDFLLRLLLSPVRPISRLEPRTRRTVPRAIIDLKARTGVRAIRIPGPFVSLRSNDVPQRLWKAPMPSSTLLAARVRALAMVLAVGLAAAPSHAGDDIRAGPDPHRQGAARRQGERRAARRQLQGAARPARPQAAAGAMRRRDGQKALNGGRGLKLVRAARRRAAPAIRS
jgi:hypothetical protein